MGNGIIEEHTRTHTLIIIGAPVPLVLQVTWRSLNLEAGAHNKLRDLISWLWRLRNETCAGGDYAARVCVRVLPWTTSAEDADGVGRSDRRRLMMIGRGSPVVRSKIRATARSHTHARAHARTSTYLSRKSAARWRTTCSQYKAYIARGQRV